MAFKYSFIPFVFTKNEIKNKNQVAKVTFLTLFSEKSDVFVQVILQNVYHHIRGISSPDNRRFVSGPRVSQNTFWALKK